MINIEESDLKVCPICNKEFKANYGRKYCYDCSPSTNNPTTKVKAMKCKLIEILGGKCVVCGYDKCIDALEFHHIEPSEKEFTFANKGTASFEKLLIEASKCELLCSNCHRKKHFELNKNNRITADNKCSKKVSMMDLDGNYICSFNSITDAVKHIGKGTVQHISDCCRNKRKTAYGYRWSFE